jgi:hypothetical protein
VPALTRTISSDGLVATSVSYPDGAMIIEAESGDCRPSPAKPTSKQPGYLEELFLLTVRSPFQKQIVVDREANRAGR